MSRQAAWFQALILPILLWAFSRQLYSGNTIIWSLNKQNQPSVLLLTAHPDDECMFFAPTVLTLTRETRRVDEIEPHIPVQGYRRVYSLCLSSGDADGLGEIRKDELRSSLEMLGVPSERSWVLNSPFKDNITAFWDSELIADYVKPYIVDYKIDIVLTFDEHGVSSHPNHISLLHGVRVLLADPSLEGLRAFSLKTTALVPKYSGALSALAARFELALCSSLALPYFNKLFDSDSQLWNLVVSFASSITPASCSVQERDEHALFLSSWSEYLLALRAMRQHNSQLVWFRWLYVAFSRYMWVNTWEMIQPER